MTIKLDYVQQVIVGRKPGPNDDKYVVITESPRPDMHCVTVAIVLSQVYFDDADDATRWAQQSASRIPTSCPAK